MDINHMCFSSDPAISQGTVGQIWEPNFDSLTQAPACVCPQPLLPGAERQVQALLSRYGPGKLYQVTGNISGAGTLDLTLPRGQVVALLQNKDTKGNSSRWLVDTGGT